jgi:transcriptional regulator with XRE-family HTH domain
MDKIHTMNTTLGERIRSQRTLMHMTQEELAEALCVKKSTVSMYENDKVDIKGSVLIELSKILNTSVTYLLGQEEYGEDFMEMLTIWNNLKNPKLKKAAINQMRALSELSE